MNIHRLDGCAPVPLAHYLKALGILRVVAEQADPQARGWWEGERFCLTSTLDRQQLLSFFLNDYSPTSFASPWNRGSGFYATKDGMVAAFEGSTATRFDRTREGIAASRNLLGDLTAADQKVRAIKEQTKIKGLSKLQRKKLRDDPEYKKQLAEAERRFGKLKKELLPQIRRTWRGSHLEWMGAAVVLNSEGEPKYPSLLGTGGTDGNLDFTYNFLARLSELFDPSANMGPPRVDTEKRFTAAIWGNVADGYEGGNAVGQFLPGMAGGANSSNGPDAESLLNSADFVLMMEGCVLFSANATRRMDAAGQSRAAAPFAVSAQSAGYMSASDSDEKNRRGEQWMPLWSNPVTLGELRRLLSEGRAQVGTRQVKEPLDLARAVAGLGIARGIGAFQRFGYIERNGQSTLAVPLGRFRVPDFAQPRLSCLDDLEAWLTRLRRVARDANAPSRLRDVERRLSDSLFCLVESTNDAARWCNGLLLMQEVEGIMATGSGFRAGPVPPLRPEWVAAADDGSPEFRLAVSCALQRWGQKSHNPAADTVRRHWLPLAKGRFRTSGGLGQARLQVTPEVVMHGRDGMADAIALVERRLVEAEQEGERRLPLSAANHAGATASDLALLVAGSVDLDRAMALARAFMAVDRWKWFQLPQKLSAPEGVDYPDDSWLVIRLAMLPYPLPDGRCIGTDPAILRRLGSGDASAALVLANQRLRAAGINATVRTAAVTTQTARLWAAALAFPISKHTAADFLRRIDPHVTQGGNSR